LQKFLLPARSHPCRCSAAGPSAQNFVAIPSKWSPLQFIGGGHWPKGIQKGGFNSKLPKSMYYCKLNIEYFQVMVANRGEIATVKLFSPIPS
jgi:hypothetical protein